MMRSRPKGTPPARGDKAAAWFFLHLDAGLRAAAKTVAAVLVSHCNPRTGRCDPGISTLTRETGLERRTIFRALVELEDAGLIVRSPHAGGSSRNAYAVNWPAMRWPAERNDAAQHADAGGGVGVTPPGGVGVTSVVAWVSPKTEKETEKENSKAGSPGKWQSAPERQPALLLPIRGGRDRSTSSRSAVMREQSIGRWDADLRLELGERYAHAVDLVDAELADAATEAEMRQRGQGAKLILSALANAAGRVGAGNDSSEENYDHARALADAPAWDKLLGEGG